MGSRRASASLLAFLVLFVSAGCLSDLHASYYYASDLEAGSAQAFFWPADATRSSFRYVVQSRGESLESASIQLIARDRPETTIRAQGLAAELESATVLLAESSAALTRARADELLAALSRQNPRLSTHVILLPRDPAGVRTGAELGGLLQDARIVHQQTRPAGLGQSMSGLVGMCWSLNSLPNYWVVPLADAEHRFAVIGDQRREDKPGTLAALRIEEIVPYVTPRLLEAPARELHAEWGSPRAGGGSSISMTRAGSVLIGILVPEDAPATARAACEELARALLIEPLAPIAIALADTRWAFADGKTVDDVVARIPTFPEWSFVSGPVRQLVLVPRPEPERR